MLVSRNAGKKYQMGLYFPKFLSEFGGENVSCSEQRSSLLWEQGHVKIKSLLFCMGFGKRCRNKERSPRFEVRLEGLKHLQVSGAMQILPLAFLSVSPDQYSISYGN